VDGFGSDDNHQCMTLEEVDVNRIVNCCGLLCEGAIRETCRFYPLIFVPNPAKLCLTGNVDACAGENTTVE